MTENVAPPKEVEATIEIAHKMNFTFYKNSPRVRLDGIPPNMNQALELVFHAAKSIVFLFVERAKEGKLDETNTIIESKIITPPKDIVTPNEII